MVVTILLLAGGASRRFHRGQVAAAEEQINKVYLPLVPQGGAETGSLRRGLDGLVCGLKSTEPNLALVIQPVIRQGDQEPLAQALQGFAYDSVKLLPAVMGGATRGASVRAGLAALQSHLQEAMHPDRTEIWVHDAARPEVRTQTVRDVRETFVRQEVAGVFPALPIFAALRRYDGVLTDPVPTDAVPSKEGKQESQTLSTSAPRLVESLSRTQVVAAHTPQVFRLSALLAAHQQTQNNSTQNTEQNPSQDSTSQDSTSQDPTNQDPTSQNAAADDDAGLVAAAGGRVALVPDTADNVKLTTPEDYLRLVRYFADRAAQTLQLPVQLRCGTGWDVHAFAPRTSDSPPLKLGGIEIASEQTLSGHSDGDAVLHAICDAIFSALGEADLGARFPSSDPSFKGADSADFIKAAKQACVRRGATLCNVSITILAQSPQIAPYRTAMTARIAELLGLAPNQVGITATTSDGLGSLGRGEGLAANAQVLLYLSPETPETTFPVAVAKETP